MSSTKTNSYIKSDYIQPSSSHPYDSSQSPLALLAQTCSSIGKDCSSTSYSTPSMITSLVTKSSSNLSTSDKSYTSTKRLSPPNMTTHKKSTLPLKTNIISPIEPNYFPPLFDPTTSVAALLLHSSLAYLASQQHSYSSTCTIPGCLYCETTRHMSSTSLNSHHPYVCHWITCNARFSSNNQLIEHIRYNHRSSKLSDHHHRYHPYLKPSKMMNTNDQLPFVYPHLSLSSMTETTQRLNNHPNNNN